MAGFGVTSKTGLKRALVWVGVRGGGERSSKSWYALVSIAQATEFLLRNCDKDMNYIKTAEGAEDHGHAPDAAGRGCASGGWTCPAVSHTLNRSWPRFVWKSSGWTSTPRVAAAQRGREIDKGEGAVAHTRSLGAQPLHDDTHFSSSTVHSSRHR